MPHEVIMNNFIEGYTDIFNYIILDIIECLNKLLNNLHFKIFSTNTVILSYGVRKIRFWKYLTNL